jgi:hypothetical protein
VVAAAVVIAYAQVDGGAFLGEVPTRLWRHAGWVALVLAAIGMLLGGVATRRAWVRPASRQARAWPVELVLAAAGVWIGSAVHGWDTWGDASDAWKASTLVVWGAVVGAGVGVGQRRCAQDRRARVVWIALRVLPLAVLTTTAGAWPIALALFWLCALAHGIGAAVLRVLARPADEAPAVLSVAVGLAVAMLAALGLGVLGCASRGAALGLLVTASVLVRRDLVRCAARAARSLAAAPPLGVSAAAAHGALLALLALFWIAALAPEVGADALGFRIAGPVHWQRIGALVPLPEMLGSYGMCGAEALLLLALPVLGTEAAKLLQLAVALLLLHGLVQQARGSRAAAPWIGFLFFASTLIWVQIAWGFVDLLQLFFAYAAVRAVLEGRDRERAVPWCIVAGIPAGAAAAVKLNGVFVLFIAGAVAAVWHPSFRGFRGFRGFGGFGGFGGIGGPGRLRALVRIGCALGVPFTAVLAPWLVRGLVLTGNPVFPFANGVFRSELAPLALVTIPFGTGHDPLGLLRLPLAAFWTPQQMVEIGTYHPGLLALLPLALAGLGARSAARARAAPWLLAGVLASALWALTDQNLRYGMLGAFFLAIGIAGGLAAWEERAPRALGATVALVALLGLPLELLRPVSWLWHTVSGPALPASVVLGEQSRADYLALRVRDWPCAEWLNRHAGAGARVWQVDVRDHLYFTAPCTALPHGVQHLVVPLAELLSDPPPAPAEIHRRLRALGYTHLLWDSDGRRLRDALAAQRTGVFDSEFVRRCLTPCAGNLGIELYALLPEPRTDDEMAAAAARATDVLAGTAFAPVGDGDRVAARVAVAGDALYALEVELAPSAAGSALRVMIEWRGAGDALALFTLRDLAPPAGAGTLRLLQTAPASAQTAVVSLTGGGALARRVRLLHLSPSEPEPTAR